jgi:hypothetical protein
MQGKEPIAGQMRGSLCDVCDAIRRRGKLLQSQERKNASEPKKQSCSYYYRDVACVMLEASHSIPEVEVVRSWQFGGAILVSVYQLARFLIASFWTTSIQ